MKKQTTTVHLMHLGMFQTNCYLIETADKNLIVIDPGDQSSSILDFCKKGGLTVSGILLTHGHFDHITAVTALKDKFNVDVYLCKPDEDLLINPDIIGLGRLANMRMDGYRPEPATKYIVDGDEISLSGITLKVIHTPGHTKGSCCFAYEDESLLFTGDTLFAGSVGRTDLYGGDEKALLQSVKKLSGLECDYTILAGHGESSKLSYEKQTNPFMGSNYDDIF